MDDAIIEDTEIVICEFPSFLADKIEKCAAADGVQPEEWLARCFRDLTNKTKKRQNHDYIF